MNLAEHPTVRRFRETNHHANAERLKPLDAAWLRQLCLDCGADDAGLVEIDDEVRQTLVLGHVRIGAGDEHPAIGELRGDVQVVHHDEARDMGAFHFVGEERIEIELVPHVEERAWLVEQEHLRFLH